MKINRKLISFLITTTILLLSFSSFSYAVDVPTVSVESKTALIGQQVTIAVTIDQIPADWISFDAILSYDKSKLKYVSYSDGDVFANITGNNDEINGQFMVSVATDYPWTSGSKLFEITFMVNEDAELGNTPITLISDELILGNINFQSIQTNIQNGVIYITVDEATALSYVNSTQTPTEMQNVLSEYGEILGLDLNGDYASLNNKTPIYEALVGQNFQSVTDLQSAFNTAVAEQKQAEEAAAQLQQAIQDAITAINNLPQSITLEDKNAVENARTLVNTALGLGATETDIINLSVLKEAEDTISALENLQQAIQVAIAAIDNLPNTITLDDKADVEVAKTLVEAALNTGATEDDITNLDKLVAAEARIAELEQELNDAIQAAIAAIDNLPDTITLDNKAVVEAARVLVEVAVNAGANESDITNLDKLIAAETRITELEQQLSDAIQAAIEAINVLPNTIEFNNPEHAALVENARALVEEAFALGATETDISNYTILLQAEAALKHGFLAGAINIPFDNYNLTDVEVKFMLDDILLAILKLDFTNGIAVIPNDTVKIPIMNITDSSKIIVLINGFIGKVAITPAEINNGDIFDLSSLVLVPGDVNGDGTIDVLDVAVFAQMFNEITTDRAYDLNGDGEVNVKDLYYIGKNFD